LLCALLVLREREVTDTLAQLLISTIHRINAHAEQKVVAEFVKDFRRVRGKDTMLRKIAEASLKTPDDSVREVIYPVVGGEATLTDLVNEYRATGSEYQRQKRKVFKASYTNHYRRGLIRLLGVLEFRSNNTAHQPVVDALALIVRYAHHGGTYYPLGEHVVLDGAVNAEWTELLIKTDSRGRMRVVRGVYEAWSFKRCVSGCVARRSGSSARTNGETPTRTSRPTSRSTAPSTTTSCASPWTPPCSPRNCERRCAPSSPHSTTRFRTCRGCGSPIARAARSSSPPSSPSPSRATCGA
jgi:hypothetical protein